LSVFRKDDTKSGFDLVDFENNFNVINKPNKADSCLPNPVDNLIAFRMNMDGATLIQIYDLGKGTKLKSVELTETFTYWKWVNKDVIAIVGDTSVFHLNVYDEKQTALDKVFERSGNLAPGNKCQIINYSLDPNGRYCYLAGISASSGQINGDMQ